MCYILYTDYRVTILHRVLRDCNILENKKYIPTTSFKLVPNSKIEKFRLILLSIIVL